MDIIDDLSRALVIPRWQVLEALGTPPRGKDFFSLVEARSAYYLAKSGSEDERAALIAWNAFVQKAIDAETTVPGIFAIYVKAPLTDTKGTAFTKWEALSRAQIEAAQTEAEIKEAFQNAPPGPVQQEAIRKLAALYGSH
jgi:hypothetical protein